MSDIAHIQTDDILIALERKLKKTYHQAYREVAAKAKKYFEGFQQKERAMRQKVISGQMTEQAFNDWRRRQMMTGRRWVLMCNSLADDLVSTNQIAAEMVAGEMYEIAAINANYTEYSIENGRRTNYMFNLYSAKTVENLVKNNPSLIPWKPSVDVPADKRWNREMITKHITQGILQGESIPNISKRLMKTVNNDHVAAVRTARTAVTTAESAGRQMVYEEAAAMGIEIQKEWVATNDARTRPAHGDADGQKVAVDKPFSVGGYKMMRPGDGSLGAPASLIYNCRCTTKTVDPVDAELGEEPRMLYSEWVKTKEAQDEIKAKRHRDYLKRKAAQKKKKEAV